MKTRRDDFDLATELRALRPAPRPEFAAELDARVASSFVSQADPQTTAWERLLSRVRELRPRRVLAPVAASVLLAVIVATAIIVHERPADNRSGGTLLSLETPSPGSEGSGAEYESAPPTGAGAGQPSQSNPAGAQGAGTQSTHPSAGTQMKVIPENGAASAPAAGNRDIERDAELVLRAEPGGIDAEARGVFDAVRAARGIVLHSSIHDSPEDAARSRAAFNLLIPSTRLGDTMGALSRVAAVDSRREGTADITAPTAGARDRLRDSEAKIDGLLAQLAGSESDEERVAVERDLRHERRIAASLRTQLDRLHRRARYARVTVRIEPGAAAGSGAASWGVGDALDDAGRVLVVAAGVVLIGLAVVGPLLLVALLAWLASRAWVRRRRESALG